MDEITNDYELIGSNDPNFVEGKQLYYKRLGVMIKKQIPAKIQYIILQITQV